MALKRNEDGATETTTEQNYHIAYLECTSQSDKMGAKRKRQDCLNRGLNSAATDRKYEKSNEFRLMHFGSGDFFQSEIHSK